MKLSVSTGACYRLGFSENKSIQFIRGLQGVQGIERMFASPSKLTGWSPSKAALKQLKEFELVSLHFPFAKHIERSKRTEAELVSTVNRLNEKFAISHAVVHPACVNDWGIFKTSNVAFLVENEEYGSKRKGFQTAGEIRLLLQKNGMQMCLDLNHAMSNGIAPKEFLVLKDKIKQVHVNTTEHFGSNADHCTLQQASKNARQKAVEALLQLENAVWAIEPVAYSKRSIRKEVEFLKKIVA